MKDLLIFLLSLSFAFIVIVLAVWGEYKLIYPLIGEDYSEWLIIIMVATFFGLVWINGKLILILFPNFGKVRNPNYKEANFLQDNSSSKQEEYDADTASNIHPNEIYMSEALFMESAQQFFFNGVPFTGKIIGEGSFANEYVFVEEGVIIYKVHQHLNGYSVLTHRDNTQEYYDFNGIRISKTEYESNI